MKTYFFIFAALVCCSNSVSSLDAFPASYPFENEIVRAALVRPSTPSKTYDDTDPGGYIYVGAVSLELTESDLPTCHALKGMGEYYLIKNNFPASLPMVFFNCTKKFVIDDDYYTGEFGGVHYCDKGDCCKEYIGLPTANPPIDAEKTKRNLDWQEIGGCPDLEFPLYCAGWSGGLNSNCIEQLVTPAERLVLYPCYDYQYHTVFSCSLYKLTGFWVEGFEPPLYIEGSTVEENTSGSVAFNYPDKVCRPYSYYNPEAFGKGGAADVTREDSSPSSSAVLLYFFPFFAVAAIL